MKSSILTFFLSLILGTTLAHGATVVVTDSNAQTEINSANNGDIIRFMPGTYPKLTVIEKDLVFRHHGSVKANVFEIEANGSKLDLIDFSAAEVFANKSQNRTSCLRVVRGKYGRITSDADNTILAYSTLNYLKITDSGTITGNEFDGDTQFFSQVPAAGGIGIDVNATSANVMINNNYIHGYKINSTTTMRDQCIGIRILGSAGLDILNNYIKNCFDVHSWGTEYTSGMGVFVHSSQDVRILGNIIVDCFIPGGANGNNIGNAAIYAPAGVVAQNNLYHNSHHLGPSANVSGGVISLNSIFADPKLNTDNTLKPDSPAIDAGPPDPQYNDRDGSRNDIGMFGGHNFIPDGRTTNKPIVLGLDIAPIAVPTGGTVTIESTGATVK